jgi:hypothetical protein
MDSAYLLYSFKRFCQETVAATEIKSPSDARKLGPFVDVDKSPFTWVNWCKRKRNGKKITLILDDTLTD